MSPWQGKTLFGLVRCAIAVDPRGASFRRAFGLGGRTIAFPWRIEIGALARTELDPVMSSYADDLQMNVPSTTVRAGRYLRLVGDRSMAVGCRQGTDFKAHWRRDGWTEGGRRRATDLIVDRQVFVAIEYALAHLGLLVPMTRA